MVVLDSGSRLRIRIMVRGGARVTAFCVAYLCCASCLSNIKCMTVTFGCLDCMVRNLDSRLSGLDYRLAFWTGFWTDVGIIATDNHCLERQKPCMFCS